MYSPCAILKIFFFLSVIFSVPFCGRPGEKRRQHGSSESFVPVFPVRIIKEPMKQLSLREAISQCLRCAAIRLCRARRLFSQDLSGILWIRLVLWRTPARRLVFSMTSEGRKLTFYSRSTQASTPLPPHWLQSSSFLPRPPVSCHCRVEEGQHPLCKEKNKKQNLIIIGKKGQS